jgi:hypothetical protein
VSDYSQGPGWWQASDGKWYPPEQAPGYQTPQPGAPFAGAPYGGAPGGGAATFDVGAAFSWTMNKFQTNVQSLLMLGLVVAGIPFLIALISLFARGSAVQFSLTVASSLIGIILTMLTVQAGLELANTGTLNPAEMWKFKANIANYVIGAVLFVIMQILGLCVFCVGALFVWLIFGLWSFLVVDRNAGAVDSLTGSKDLVLGPGFGQTFLGMLVFLVLSLLSTIGGAVTCGLGGLIGIVTVPFASLFGAYVYRSFTGQAVAP